MEEKPRTVVDYDELEHEGSAADDPDEGFGDDGNGADFLPADGKAELTHRAEADEKSERHGEGEGEGKDEQGFAKAFEKA